MILLVRHAEIDPARTEEYRRFQQEQCLPTLRRQPGFLGVLFLREAEDHAVSLTIWEDRGAVEALESSPSCRRTASELAERELLGEENLVEVLEVRGGDLRPEALMGALDRTRRAGAPVSARGEFGGTGRPASVMRTESPDRIDN